MALLPPLFAMTEQVNRLASPFFSQVRRFGPEPVASRAIRMQPGTPLTRG